MSVESLELHMLSHELRFAKKGTRALDKLIGKLFERTTREPWSTRFEKAADLFKQEFEPFGWSRECLSNSCQGIYWMLTGEAEGEYYTSVGETDALALCAAMVKAKRGEREA